MEFVKWLTYLFGHWAFGRRKILRRQMVDVLIDDVAHSHLEFQREMQSWALSVFLNLFNNKKRFAFFNMSIWLAVGFLNRTGAKIVINLIKNAIVIFYYWKNEKMPKVPTSGLRWRA